jgi:hypothetical protein
MSDNKFIPQKVNDETVSISGYFIPIREIGCYLDIDSIIIYWQQLEKEGFPLVRISSLLVTLEYMHWTKKNMSSLLPFPIHIIRMVDAIYCAKFINGGKQRINNLKKQLCSLITESTNFPKRQSITKNKILESVITISDEFRIGYILLGLKPTLRFNTEKGPDFYFDGININLTVEAKSRLNRTYLGEIGIKENMAIQLDESICLRLLSRDAFKSGTFSKAFEEQKTDIALINMSHSEFGDLFAAFVYIENKGYEFEVAVNYATKLVKEGKKAVILYSEVISNNKPYRIGAISTDKETVYSLGAKLDKKEKDVGINERDPNYYFRIINEARQLKL